MSLQTALDHMKAAYSDLYALSNADDVKLPHGKTIRKVTTATTGDNPRVIATSSIPDATLQQFMFMVGAIVKLSGGDNDKVQAISLLDLQNKA